MNVLSCRSPDGDFARLMVTSGPHSSVSLPSVHPWHGTLLGSRSDVRSKGGGVGWPGPSPGPEPHGAEGADEEKLNRGGRAVRMAARI